MARRIGVIEAHQQDSNPSRFVKKVVAHMLIRKCLAIWIAENAVLKMRKINDMPCIPTERVILPAKIYIPEKMPPREVPGCFFQLPQSDTWREQHRTVRF